MHTINKISSSKNCTSIYNLIIVQISTSLYFKCDARLLNTWIVVRIFESKHLHNDNFYYNYNWTNVISRRLSLGTGNFWTKQKKKLVVHVWLRQRFYLLDWKPKRVLLVLITAGYESVPLSKRNNRNLNPRSVWMLFREVRTRESSIHTRGWKLVLDNEEIGIFERYDFKDA